MDLRLGTAEEEGEGGLRTASDLLRAGPCGGLPKFMRGFYRVLLKGLLGCIRSFDYGPYGGFQKKGPFSGALITRIIE